MYQSVRSIASACINMELHCKVQNYAWGKKGLDSLVAQLQSNCNKDFAVKGDVSYAELWMGTHVNGPSTIRQTGEALELIIKQNSGYLGDGVIQQFGIQLPYLFKVLSVNTALSIQAHPNKEHAEELHSKFPDIYKDPNHKPELAIALTPFEALCGFRPVNEIKNFILGIPELKNVIGGNIVKQHQQDKDDELLLRQAFRAVLTNKVNLKNEMENMLARFKKLDHSQRNQFLADLIETLYKDYPNDPGCFMVYFLNYIKLQPGEALFLAANDPHAYLLGDCIECMACSDNVVRAGLTPKFIDVETLCNMLIYKGQKPSDKLFKPVAEDPNTLVFKPPVPDFAVAEIKIQTTTVAYKLKERASASILLVIEGEANLESIALKTGSVIFIPANQIMEIRDISADLKMYQAFANV